jgi:hypothetical protein
MAKSASAKQLVKKTVRPKHSGQIPVTAKMLQKTRAELKSDITTLRLETRAGFKKVDARFDTLEAMISGLQASIHRMQVLFEEQNARNVYVLDGYASLDARLKVLEGS